MPTAASSYEDPVKAIVLWCGGPSRFGIAAPEDCDFVGLRVRLTSVHATLLAWRVAQSLDGRLTGCLLDPVAMLSAFPTADNNLIHALPRGTGPPGRTLFCQAPFAAVSRS